MTATEQNTEIINDLVMINNDRIQGYNRAAEETKPEDSDLKQTFSDMADQSVQYRQELSDLLSGTGEQPERGTRTDGKIYRTWMDVKATFSGHSRKSVLENCEFGEDAAQKAYKSALSPDNGLTDGVRAVISRQQQGLKGSHDLIRSMRDRAK